MALIWGNWGVDVRFYVRNPEKAHPWAERRVLAYFASKSPRALGCSELQEPKKLTRFWCAKSRMRRSETPARIVTNFWSWGPRRNHMSPFVLRSHTGFERGGGSNFGFLHLLASSPLQRSRTTVQVCDIYSPRATVDR